MTHAAPFHAAPRQRRCKPL